MRKRSASERKRRREGEKVIKWKMYSTISILKSKDHSPYDENTLVEDVTLHSTPLLGAEIDI